MVRRRGHVAAFLLAIVLVSAFAGCSAKKASTLSTEEPAPEDPRSTRGSRQGSGQSSGTGFPGQAPPEPDDEYNVSVIATFRLNYPLAEINPAETKDVTIGGDYDLVRVTCVIFQNSLNPVNSGLGGVVGEGTGVDAFWDDGKAFVAHRTTGSYTFIGGTTYYSAHTLTSTEDIQRNATRGAKFTTVGWGDMYVEVTAEALRPLPAEETEEDPA